MTFLAPLIVAPSETILGTMQTIDRNGLEVALVCDADRTLLSVVTDGDIRRAIIHGAALSDPVQSVGSPHFAAVPLGTPRTEALDAMLLKRIKCLPVLDDTGRVVDIHTLTTALSSNNHGSWAIIMAGGKGERLGELTKGAPTPMLPIGDRPILEHIVRLLVTHGVRRIFISVGYLASMIRDHFGDGSDFQCRIEYLYEKEDQPLGTGGAIALLPETPTEPLIVMNGDLLTRINIGRLLDFHRGGGYVATMSLREHAVQVPFGVAEVADSRVIKLVEKPKLNYQINAGIYVLNPELVQTIPTVGPYPITDLFNTCLKTGNPVGAYHMQESWVDIGLPEEYHMANGGAK